MFEGKKVLYLEDEPLVAFDTGEHLESLGFDQVSVSYRLAQATAEMDKTDFDIAILDINVDKGQTSCALGQALKDKGTPVIFASGTGDMAGRLEEQGYVFLDKPFTLNDLTRTIARTLG